MKRISKKVMSLLLIVAMLLPMVVTVHAANGKPSLPAPEVSAGMVQNSRDLPRLDINSDADLGSTIYQSKDNKVDATAKISEAEDSRHNVATSPIELKTRGNTTWGVYKWAYQIKFDSKVDLFDMGKAKKWILLANYYDGTFVRNKVIFDLGKEIGMPYVVESVYVNLYINGEYKGIYQLCEKVELGSSRIDIDSDYGVLLEMDATNRPAELEKEIYFTTTTTGKPFVYKEYNTDFEDDAEAEKVAEIRRFTEDHINTFEAELYSDDADWETIESMIDVDSFIRYYFISEFTMEVDATYSSTFFYIDGPGDVLHCGPLWDYDRIMGWDTSYDQTANNDYMKNITDATDEFRVEWYKMLFRHPEFVKRVNEMYDEVIRDAFDTEKVIGMIDYYQDLIMPTLVYDHDVHFSTSGDIGSGYYVFHNRSHVVEELLGKYASSEQKIKYTTDAMKDWLTERNEYLETAYGSYHPFLTYNVYDNSTGWQTGFGGGSMTFTVDNAITALKINLVDNQFDGGIEYAYAKSGAISKYVSGGEELKTPSNGRFSGICVKLTGNLANYFSVEYRVCNYSGWSRWVSDDDLAGSISSSDYIRRIQIRLVQHTDVAEGSISFVTDAGIAPDTVNGIVGNTVKLQKLEADGYTFEGWYTSSDFKGEAVESMEIAEGNTVLYAKMKYELIGDVDGDGEITMLDLFALKLFIKQKDIPTAEEVKAADLDGDGEITMVDSFELKYRISKGFWRE
ncbi:MAG: CotH kinase family protein [Clostridia bacterium]|nr:CotH kinase family protein [Clostridia bacterium]